MNSGDATMVEAVALVAEKKRCVPHDPEFAGYHWVRRFDGAPPIVLYWNPVWWHNADRGWGLWGEPDREDKWEYLGAIAWPSGYENYAMP